MVVNTFDRTAPSIPAVAENTATPSPAVSAGGDDGASASTGTDAEAHVAAVVEELEAPPRIGDETAVEGAATTTTEQVSESESVVPPQQEPPVEHTQEQETTLAGGAEVAEDARGPSEQSSDER